MPRTYPRVEHLSLQPYSQTLDQAERNKHSSLLPKLLNFSRIKFYNIGPQKNAIIPDLPYKNDNQMINLLKVSLLPELLSHLVYLPYHQPNKKILQRSRSVLTRRWERMKPVVRRYVSLKSRLSLFNSIYFRSKCIYNNHNQWFCNTAMVENNRNEENSVESRLTS